MTAPPVTIVIFGAAVLPNGEPSRILRARVDAAFACGGLDSCYIPTGAALRGRPSEASVMARLLAQHGVASSQITLELSGTDTLSSALAINRMLRGAPGPVRACSDGFHLPRCLLLLRLAGLRAMPCKPPTASTWAWYWRLREVAALPYDAVLMCGRRVLGRL